MGGSENKVGDVEGQRREGGQLSGAGHDCAQVWGWTAHPPLSDCRGEGRREGGKGKQGRERRVREAEGQGRGMEQADVGDMITLKCGATG